MGRRISEELYFNDELRKCLNDAGLSDKAWNYWYQRVHKAHDQAIDRVEATQRVENDKLRELVRDMWFWSYEGHMCSESQEWQMKHIDRVCDRMHELGVEQ